MPLLLLAKSPYPLKGLLLDFAYFKQTEWIQGEELESGPGCKCLNTTSLGFD